MRKQLVTALVCCGLILGVGLAAGAGQRGPQYDRPEGIRGRSVPAMGDFCPAPWPHLLQRLDLSEAQQKEVQKLMTAHRERADEVHGKMREMGRQLRQAMAPGKFDEKALRKLAGKRAEMTTDLMVDMAKTHAQIYALLTPEQQELVDLAAKLHRLQGKGPMAGRGRMERGAPMMPMDGSGDE